eukprot:902545-Amphidinium_carterae.1
MDVTPIDLEDDKEEDQLPEAEMDDPVLHPEESPGAWGRPLRDHVPPGPIDLDADTLVSSPPGHQQDDLFILTSSLEDGTPKEIKQELIDQSLTVPLVDIRTSSGSEREKWIQASQKEIDTLISSKTISSITLSARDSLRLKCKTNGTQYSELPCKGVFTIKPEKYKARICGCGNFEQDTYGSTATNEMDACIMRYLLSQTQKPTTDDQRQVLSTLDYTGAFLNAELPEGR